MALLYILTKEYLEKLAKITSITSSRRVAVITGAALVVLVVIDLLMTRQILPRDSKVEDTMFILTVVICYGIGSWILLRYTKRISREMRTRSQFFNLVHRFAIIIQFSLLGILVLIIYGNLTNCYDYFSFCMITRPLAVSVNAIASASAGVVLGLICYKFFSWFGVDRRNYIVLLYGLGAAALILSITVDAGDKILLQRVVEENSPEGASLESAWIYKTFEKYDGQVQYKVVNPETTTLYVVPDSLTAFHKFLVYLVSDTPYVFTWAGTLMLLRQFYISSGRRKNTSFPTRYLILLSIPLVLYIIGSGIIISLPPSDDPNRYYYRILFRAGTIGSSALFGLAFYVITREVEKRGKIAVERIKDYLTVSAIGIVMIGIANEASGLQQTYGVAAHGLVFLSAFLYSVGLYYLAISVSEDSSLRKAIRKSALELLDDIGTAQMEQELRKKILRIVEDNKDKMEEQTGGLSYTVTKNDLKEYMELILDEKKKSVIFDSKESKNRTDKEIAGDDF
jgi:hypothetical protein